MTEARIPAARVSFIEQNPRTGAAEVSRPWFLFLQAVADVIAAIAPDGSADAVAELRALVESAVAGRRDPDLAPLLAIAQAFHAERAAARDYGATVRALEQRLDSLESLVRQTRLPLVPRNDDVETILYGSRH